jgi:trimeric autotransporter adhesin
VITTFAGNGVSGFTGNGGPATAASLNSPFGVAVDSAGNLYIADTNNGRIRKVSNGVISSVVGNGLNNPSPDGTLASAASIGAPTSVALDSANNIYFALPDFQKVRKVSNGILSTVAGSGTAGFSGDNGPATAAALNGPNSVVVTPAGDIFIADSSGFRIRKVSGGTITTVAGTGVAGFSGDGGPAVSAMLRFIPSMALDAAGSLYLGDSSNGRVRKISNGIITTVAGNGNYGVVEEEVPAVSAFLNSPYSVAVDFAGTVYIADTSNSRVRKVENGVITTVAGTGSAGFSGDDGPAASAMISRPQGLAVDAAGDVYIADTGTRRIRKVSNGIITTVAGNGSSGILGDGGPATEASLNFPSGVAVDPDGNLYIADTSSHRIRKVSDGKITTIAGNGTGGFSGDNGPATSAMLREPRDVAVDTAGNVYISDSRNHRVRKVSNGIITTVAGNGTEAFFGDGGAGASGSLAFPDGLAVDAEGNLSIADSGNDRIRKVANGIITTVAGNSQPGFSGEGGPPAAASLNIPRSVAFDAADSLYISDGDNNRIRKVAFPPVITSINTAGGSSDIAQNDFIAIKGTNLAPASALIWSLAPEFAVGKMPTLLATVKVTVNGKPAFVFYVSPVQLNVLTPLDNTVGPVQVVVTNGPLSSAPFTVNLRAVAPALLKFGATNYVTATHLNFSLLGPPALSAPGFPFTGGQPRETIILFAVGFGLPSAPLVNGSSEQFGALPEKPVILIGGVQAEVTFAGVIAPGLYQFNVVLPAGLSNGDNAIVCTYKGVSTAPGDLLFIQQ